MKLVIFSAKMHTINTIKGEKWITAKIVKST
jgi:hypothetical protein